MPADRNQRVLIIGAGKRLQQFRRNALFAGAILLFARIGTATAAELAPFDPAVDLTLEQLVNVKITSVSKKEEDLNDAAAAIFVLSNDDMRRSGFTTVADALRLVPGLQVAALDASTWAISARGFNSQYANKLLVMIDGRSVYSPLFSGVYWDVQQMMLDDVARIEVIRGPGATVWGANAVNGVINIISKRPGRRRGDHLRRRRRRASGTGRRALRRPDRRDTYYRIYGTYQFNNDFQQANGQSANDGWDLVQGGFRVDHYTGNDGQLTWQGDGYAGNLADYTGDLNGFNTLGRWTQRIAERSSYEVQAYFDHTYRNDALAEVSVDTAELTFQHTFGLGERNDVIWGLGYRFMDTRSYKANSPAVTILDDNIPLNLFSAFVQDEFKIIPDQLTFTLGTKIEHNDFTGFEVQPSARLVFNPTANQTVWAAVSRAVRTPSEVEGRDSPP